ncbi:hypothetical protein [Streptomyces mesophilus]|uniref:hypothetical protein n=1 Tax=Streptomyces mesophilus TaxID=1775132 RepID=UPI003334A466
MRMQLAVQTIPAVRALLMLRAIPAVRTQLVVRAIPAVRTLLVVQTIPAVRAVRALRRGMPSRPVPRAARVPGMRWRTSARPTGPQEANRTRRPARLGPP